MSSSRLGILWFWDKCNRCRRSIYWSKSSRRAGNGLLGRYGRRIPVKSRFDHEIHSVSFLDVVLLQKLPIRQHLALDEQSLDVLGRCTGDGSQL